jgi:NADH-quinone oxidoreductase subunit L
MEFSTQEKPEEFPSGRTHTCVLYSPVSHKSDNLLPHKKVLDILLSAYCPFGLISLAFIKIPDYEFLYYLASFTLLFHSLRAVVSQSFKEGISELYPALLSLIWLSKEETHFVFLLLPSALLYLLGIYTKRMLHTDSFYYAGGFIEKMPIYSLLLVIASLQACLTPLMPSFYPFFDALLKANVLQATLLITGWFMLGVAIALLYGDHCTACQERT